MPQKPYTEDDMIRLSTALLFASKAHMGQTDFGGVPVFFHVLRVVAAVKEDPTLALVAALHDVLEDSDITSVEDVAETFGWRVANAVDAITRRPDEDYMAYIKRCAEDEIATRVKVADLADNLRLDRQDFPTAEELSVKHTEALLYLIFHPTQPGAPERQETASQEVSQ